MLFIFIVSSVPVTPWPWEWIEGYRPLPIPQISLSPHWPQGGIKPRHLSNANTSPSPQSPRAACLLKLCLQHHPLGAGMGEAVVASAQPRQRDRPALGGALGTATEGVSLADGTRLSFWLICTSQCKCPAGSHPGTEPHSCECH